MYLVSSWAYRIAQNQVCVACMAMHHLMQAELSALKMDTAIYVSYSSTKLERKRICVICTASDDSCGGGLGTRLDTAGYLTLQLS